MTSEDKTLSSLRTEDGYLSGDDYVMCSDSRHNSDEDERADLSESLPTFPQSLPSQN